MRLEKTLCSGEIGRQFRRNRTLFPLHPPHKSPWTFVRAFATAGFPPIRNKTGWLRPPWVLFLTPLHPACSRRLGRFVSHRVSPPAGGEIKSKARVFRGHAPEENTLLGGNRATIPQESNPIPPASPSQKSLDFCESVRNGWLRSDSEQNRVAPPPWVLFLTAVQPGCDRGCSLLHYHASLPSATLDFPPSRNKFGRA